MLKKTKNKYARLNQVAECEEPGDIAFNLAKIEKQWSPSEDQSSQLKDFYAMLSNVLAKTLTPNTYEIIPVGSFVIGCLTKFRLQIDCHLNLNQSGDLGPHSVSNRDQLVVKLKEYFGEIFESGGQEYAVEQDRSDKNIVLIIDNSLCMSVRLIITSSSDFSAEEKISRATAGIFHSNWLVDIFNQSSNAWQTVKLFRLVRVWK